MSRVIPDSMQTAIAAPVVEPFYALEFYLDSETVRLWTGNYTLNISGSDFIGAGEILSISSVQETADTQANGATVSISGIPSTYLSLALQEQYQGRECRMFFGILSSPEDMVEIFSGEIDKMDINENADTAVVVVSVENVMIILERPAVRRFTHEDQQTRYPGDLGLEYVATLQDKEFFFGRKSA
jgi:LysM repeat protein